MSKVTTEAYDRARRLLAVHRKEELAMRVVELGAIEHGEAKGREAGARQEREYWVMNLKARGFSALASYLSAQGVRELLGTGAQQASKRKPRGGP